MRQNRPDNIQIDAKTVAQHLSQAIQCATVSSDDGLSTNWNEFKRFQEFLLKTYPKAHQVMQHEIIDEYSLLYIWKGQGKHRPVLLLAHQDVVYAEEEGWEYPPFAGKITDQYVWGRGALDMKSQLISIFEAAEALITAGFVPERDFYFGFSHDEEISDSAGAPKMAEVLRQRGVAFEYMLDEGTCSFLDGKCFHVDQMIATVGVSEKGYAVITVSANGSGGHASTPGKQTTLSNVARASVRIQKKSFKSDIQGAAKVFFETLAPHMKGAYKFVFNHLWFWPLKKVAIRQLEKNKDTNALVRTTKALTMAKGAVASNVLPQYAEMSFNVRIIDWDDADQLLAQVKRTANSAISEGERIEISYAKMTEPTPVSRTDSFGYALISTAIKQCFGEDMIVAPYPMLASTDSHCFSDLSDSIYRFSPYASYFEDKHSIHARNEKIKIESLKQGTEFFLHLMKNS